MMMQKNIYYNRALTICHEFLNSYSLLFFSTNNWFGLLLLVVSFFKPYAGLSGLIATALALLFVNFSGLRVASVQKGLFCYNAVLIGIGMGSFYNWGIAFWLLLFLSVLFSVLLSGVLMNLLFPKGLPFLALPFVFCFWLVMLVSREFTAIDLTTRNIYWLNQMYAVGNKELVDFMMFFENLPLHPLILIFFKSISSLLFQENVFAGILISLGLVIHSRISFTLIVIGFVTSVCFNQIVHAYDGGINYYLLGGNFMMIAIAIGGIFMIPSFFSYLWAVVAVPLSFIVAIALGKIIGMLNLPVFSMPFCLVTLLILYFFTVTRQTGRIILTPLQLYFPENNLYHFLNTSKRLTGELLFRFQLPFMGEWIVTQGYDGDITHKGDWSKALDFVIVDQEMKSYTGFAIEPENFYCYNKPVLAPADGYVQEIVDQIDDNEIGKINRQQNWGNAIIISHAEGLCTKMCHLKKNSFKVKVGDFVRKGQTVAACGNSGRSPEPHLHFQVQATPYLGSKTIEYPFEVYRNNSPGKQAIISFAVPLETSRVSNIAIDENLTKAFEFLPGMRMEVVAPGYATEYWEVFTDAFNQCYLYCHTNKTTAYFSRTSSFFYFTAFHGNRNSLLYHFYTACYKIALYTADPTRVTDEYPLRWSNNNPGKWLQDLIAPFFIFRHLVYQSENEGMNGNFFDPEINIQSSQTIQYPGISRTLQTSLIQVKQKKISSFTFQKKDKTIQALCEIKL